jgi:16S rRNA processing protein RimM
MGATEDAASRRPAPHRDMAAPGAGSREELVEIGRVGRPHGVDGAFVVEAASEDPSRLRVGAELLVDGEPAAVILSRRVGGGRRAIKLDRRAERGAELTVPRATLPPLDSDSYYVADLVGLEVFDEHGVRVGLVRDVVPGPANDALELDTGLLLPLVEECVREVDLESRRVLLNPGFTD